MADNKTTLETDVEIKVKSDELNKLQKEFKDLNKVIEDSNNKINTLKTAISELQNKKQYMTKNYFSAEYNKLSSSLENEKVNLKENKELAGLYEEEIKNVKAEISSLEDVVKANKENVEATKKNTKAKNKETKATEDSATAEEKKAKEAERAARLERDSQTKRINAEAKMKRAEAAMIAAQAKQDAVDKKYEYASRKRSTKYQVGRGLYSAGSFVGRNLPSPIANIAGTALQLAGTALTNPAMAAAVTIRQLTEAITKLGKSSIEAYGEIESIRTQLGVVYGNQSQADTVFSELSAYATKSPFGVQQTAELATLLKQSGVEASNLMDTLKMLGDTAGGNMEKMKRIANNYAQIVSIGKASMLDMRQFAYAGIPIFEKVAEELGVSQTALRSLISDGKVTSEVITKVFKDMTTEGGLFFEATSRGAETYKARLQNLKDMKQLALSGVGETILRIGEKTGGDSVAYRALELSEDFYTKLNEKTSLKNLEKSVETIKENISEQNRIKELIDYAEKTGASKDVINALKDELKNLEKQFSPEKIRSNNASLYERYYGNVKTEFNSAAEIEKAIKAEQSEYYRLNEKMTSRSAQIYNENMEGLLSDSEYENQKRYIKEYYNNEIELSALRIKNLNEQLDILKAQQNITDDIRQSWEEVQVRNNQQTFADTVKTKSESSTSVLSDWAELKRLYEETDEYKNKAQEEQNKKLQASYNILKDIASNTKEGTSIVDFNSVAGLKLTEYIKEGAVNGRKLATNRDDNGAVGDWLQLKNQVNTARENILKTLLSYEDIQKVTGGTLTSEELEKFSKYGYGGVESILSSLVFNENTMESFYKNFNKKFYKVSEEVYDKIANSSNANETSIYKYIYDTLQSALLEYSSASVEGIGLPGTTGNKKGSDETNIALWRRILANRTGLSAAAINNTRDTLETYRDDVAQRNMMKGVFGSLLRNGGNAGDIQNLIRLSGIVRKNPFDTDNTFTYDIKETSKAVKEFARQLSASTSNIEAYNQGLNAQYETYIGLLSEGILETESNTVGMKTRTVSTKTLSKAAQSFGDQLITAFGEGVTDANGNKVNWNKDTGKFTYSNGTEVSTENLRITGNIFSILQEEIPNIRKELVEGNKVAAQNKVLNNLTNTIADTKLMTALLSQTSSPVFARLSEENKSIYLSALKENLKLNSGSFGSVEDLLLAYINGDGKADSIVVEAVNNLTNASSALNKFAILLDKVNEKELKDNANIIASDLIGGKSKGFKGDYYYNFYGKEVLSGLGYGDVRFEDVASVMSRKNAISSAQLSDMTGRVQAGQLNTDNLVNELRSMGVDESYIEQIENANGKYREQIEILKELAGTYKGVTAEEVKYQLSQKTVADAVDSLKTGLVNIAKETGKSAFLSPFKTLGEDFISLADHSKDWNDYLSDAGDSLKNIAGQMLSSMGTEMATAGFRIAASAALTKNWGMVAAGLALAGAGGFASGLGSSLNKASQEEDKTAKEIEKLNNIKGQMENLLEQARADALYYENNLRHKTALGINERYSYKKVNDAIITPEGVVNTHPDDYIIATKNPQSIGKTNIKINHIVNNNAGVLVSQQERMNNDGSVDLITTIDSAIGNYIAGPKGDEAFRVREARLRGNVAVM